MTKKTGKIKILAIIKPSSSPHEHRLKYPLSKINGLEVENKKIEITFKEYSEEVLKEAEEFDIFWYHWDIGAKLEDIRALKRKIKIVYSLDDLFLADGYSVLHPYYDENMKKYAQARVIEHLNLATCVIVPNERLMLHCRNYANYIAILPNFIDPKDFKIEEKTKSDRLRVGFVFSGSHYPDMLMFKQTLNKLAANETLSKNIEYHICGYAKGDKHWEEIVAMFRKKKNITLVLKEFVPFEDYLTLYKDLDVCLIPLEYTEFNISRSALKLLECSLTNTLPVGSSLYSSKELKGIVVAEGGQQTKETLLKLLNKDYYNTVLKYVTETNLKDNNFEKRFEDTKSVVAAVAFNDLEPKLEDVKVYSIKYKKEQETDYIPYFNWRRKPEEDSVFFEYPCMIDIVDNKIEDLKNTDYLGILSWKFSAKSKINKNLLYNSLIKKKYHEYDIINLTVPYKDLQNNYLNWSNQYHPTFLDKFNKLCGYLNLEVKEPSEVVIANQFLAKKDVYIQFMNEVIKPAISVLKNEMKEEALENAKYTVGISEEECEQYFGLPYYPFAPFLPERLLSVWLMSKPELKVLNIYK